MTDSRRIAWDGVSFRVPANWELGVYKFPRKGVTRIEIEDEYSARLEAEWVRPKQTLQMQSILGRYEKASGRLTRLAHEKAAVEGLPEGWFGTLYTFREAIPRRKAGGIGVLQHSLLTAFYMCPESSLFCFVILHRLPGDTEDLAEILRLFAGDFHHHREGDLIPWEFFDVTFSLPRAFVLESAQFDVGTKLMIFRWKQRRLYLWHFSCANMIVKGDVTLEPWVTGYLNGFSGLPAPRFYPGKAGDILWKRRARHPFGHRTELAQWCFQYKVRCRVDEQKNQIIAWVFHYRKPDDLRMIWDNI
jgi:hypothetical protein